MRHLFLKYLFPRLPVKPKCLHWLVVFLLIGGGAVGADSAQTRVTTPTLKTLVVAQRGEGLHSIARRFKVSPEKLQELNPGLKAWGLLPGDAVIVPIAWDHPPELQHHLEIRRGPRGRHRIALTFDGAWTSQKQLEILLDTLKRHEAPASFFVTGIFLEKVPDGIATIRPHGHPVYNHTDRHLHLKQHHNTVVREELLNVERALAEATSDTLTTRPYWRPPFGERDARILRIAAASGFQSIGWTIDSRDWMEDPPATVDSIFERLCVNPLKDIPENDPDPLDGAIVLFHIGGKATPEALERIIPFLKKRGYNLVSLPQLLQTGY